MNPDTKEKYLQLALRAFGAVFLLVYPLGMVWPSGWVWHGGEGMYYLQMIAGVYAVLGIYLIIAAKNPKAHRGDVPALLLVAAVLGYLSPSGETHARV